MVHPTYQMISPRKHSLFLKKRAQSNFNEEEDTELSRPTTLIRSLSAPPMTNDEVDFTDTDDEVDPIVDENSDLAQRIWRQSSAYHQWYWLQAPEKVKGQPRPLSRPCASPSDSPASSCDAPPLTEIPSAHVSNSKRNEKYVCPHLRTPKSRPIPKTSTFLRSQPICLVTPKSRSVPKSPFLQSRPRSLPEPISQSYQYFPEIREQYMCSSVESYASPSIESSVDSYVDHHGQMYSDGYNYSYTTVPLQPLPKSIKSYLKDLELAAGEKSVVKEMIDNGLLIQIIETSDGSRYVQKCIEKITVDEKFALFAHITPQLISLCKHPYANYVVQKLFLHKDSDHSICPLITGRLLRDVLELSLDKYGCRVVQVAIQHSSSEVLWMLVSELGESGIMKCLDDQNGNHVLQKCIQKAEIAEPYVLEFIIKGFKSDFSYYSRHKYGCRVIQRLLDVCKKQNNKKLNASIMTQLLSNNEIELLSTNEYGNYVVQWILKDGDDRDKKSVIKRVRTKILSLTKNKFGSHVVEKCFQHSKKDDRQLFFDEVLTCGDKKSLPLIEMAKNEFGNYVLQKMLEVATKVQLQKLNFVISSQGIKLEELEFGKYVSVRIEKMQSLNMSCN